MSWRFGLWGHYRRGWLISVTAIGVAWMAVGAWWLADNQSGRWVGYVCLAGGLIPIANGAVEHVLHARANRD